MIRSRKISSEEDVQILLDVQQNVATEFESFIRHNNIKNEISDYRNKFVEKNPIDMRAWNEALQPLMHGYFLCMHMFGLIGSEYMILKKISQDSDSFLNSWFLALFAAAVFSLGIIMSITGIYLNTHDIAKELTSAKALLNADDYNPSVHNKNLFFSNPANKEDATQILESAASDLPRDFHTTLI